STGRVMLGQVPTIDPEVSGTFGTLMAWADERRRLNVRSNADVPRDARKAREFGAEGIGLCRTEHMFFAQERLPLVVEMIMSAPLAKSIEAELGAKQAALEGAVPGDRLRGMAAAKKLRQEIAVLKTRLALPLKSYRGSLARLLTHQRA